MAVVAHPTAAQHGGRSPRRHADVTRDVVATLETPSRGYVLLLLLPRSARSCRAPHLRGAGQGRTRPRRLQPADLLERLHHDLRVLGGYRTRRHADLGDSVPLPVALAHGGVPLHRGDDGVRGHDRGALPDHPHRAPVDLLLAAAVSQPAVPLAQLQVAAHLGRLRDLDLPHGVHHVPRVRADSRHRGGAGQGDRAGGRRSTRSPRWAGRAPTTSGGITPAPISTWPRWRRRWCSRCTPWCRWDFAVSIVPGWHGTIFAPYFVAGAIYSGIGMVLTLIIPLRRALTVEHMITGVPLRQPGQADAAHRLDPVLRLRDGVLRRVVQRKHVRADHLLPPRLRARCGGPGGR